MKLVSFILLLFCYSLAFSQTSPVGIFQQYTDIGKPKVSGSSQYDAATQTYTMTGGGENIWFNRDEFQYLYKKINGDFLLTANFEFVGEEGNGHRKIGWMIRESVDEAAAHITSVSHGDGLMALQWREMRGAYMRDPEDEIFAAKKGGQILQMERQGKTVTMRIANPGEPLQDVGSHEMKNMRDSVLVGLYICSHDPNKSETAKIWNVRIDKPVGMAYHPNPIIQRSIKPLQGVVGCRLETMNVFDGKRKVIRESAGRFEAPNWMPDGKKLLYNEGGSLFTIPIDGGTAEKLNTGEVNKNNNDHGISFDGKMLAISSSKPGTTGGSSAVYVLPLQGGEPKLVTEATPSYWHGWAPGAKEVVVVGQRNGSKIYNLYKVNVNTGKEVALTNNTKGHVDGCEYSPDGKYVYYNANPTGTMQVWRMKPDGSGKEQLTFDEYHSWFPHISPDGKWIAFISFPTDIEPSSHPSYKKVMLRLMPATGGAPKVIAYLYGGQGTINVNSWSPDSKSIAFVSNSEKSE
ncbi:MAG: TolB family protein [Chitinophagaceae bacterium]